MGTGKISERGPSGRKVSCRVCSPKISAVNILLMQFPLGSQFGKEKNTVASTDKHYRGEAGEREKVYMRPPGRRKPKPL